MDLYLTTNASDFSCFQINWISITNLNISTHCSLESRTFNSTSTLLVPQQGHGNHDSMIHQLGLWDFLPRGIKLKLKPTIPSRALNFSFALLR